MNNLALLSALVFEPRKAFDEIGRRPRFWFPMLLLMVAATITAVWYLSVVDLQWVVDHDIRSNPMLMSRMSEQQIQQAVDRAADSRGTRIALTAIGTPAGIVIGLLIGALYYFVAGKVCNVRRSFGQWFAFSAWTGLPAALSAIPAILVLLTSTSAQLPRSDLKTLSLNSLFFQLTEKEPGFLLASNVDLLQLLSLVLAVFGVKLWSGRSWIFSTIFVLLPAIVILGVVAIFFSGRS